MRTAQKGEANQAGLAGRGQPKGSKNPKKISRNRKIFFDV
jgi:hypothetical protein